MNTDVPTEAEGPAGAKRLAAIVAIDAAGYSRQSEIDESVAIREISALSERIRAAAAAHGGRVFNTAGDGFMLEFGGAPGALAAAEEIISNNRVPVRIGVHLGQVTQTPDEDLLGRGVNIAARLQGLAKPGEVLVSADVKNAAPPEVAARLASRGGVQLNKMRERIEVFSLSAAWKGALGL
ncbi:MAG: adenylate/guanylate cyclase domain-containing protein [Terricaulis sp.]|nr:adenylate/guanylate cyclase domain-containing protein [Terricaulis sp.]